MRFFNIEIHKTKQKRVLTFELVLEKFEDKSKWYSDALISRRTDNAMDKRKTEKGQTKV